jgi:hypothetical protein
MKQVLLFFILVAAAQSASAVMSPSCLGQARDSRSMSDQDKKDLEKNCKDALQARADRSVLAAGVDSVDCLRNLQMQIDIESQSAKSSCEANTHGLASCGVAVNTDAYVMITSTVWKEHVNRDNIPEEQCQSMALVGAEDMARQTCRQRYNVDSCDVSRRAVLTKSELNVHRRYYIAGPKVSTRICEAVSEALPSAQYKSACSATIVASSSL